MSCTRRPAGGWGKGCHWKKEQPVCRQRHTEGCGELRAGDGKFSRWSIRHVQDRQRLRLGKQELLGHKALEVLQRHLN